MVMVLACVLDDCHVHLFALSLYARMLLKFKLQRRRSTSTSKQLELKCLPKAIT